MFVTTLTLPPMAVWWTTWSNHPFTIAGGQTLMCWFTYSGEDYVGPVFATAWPDGYMPGTVMTLESGIECTSSVPLDDDHLLPKVRYWVRFYNPGTTTITFLLTAG